MSPILCKNTWNTTYSMHKKCARNIMCTGHRKCTWNCALYTVSGNPQEMYKFHVVRNLHTMNRKCDLSYTSLGISQPRKFKISSSLKGWDHMKGIIQQQEAVTQDAKVNMISASMAVCGLDELRSYCLNALAKASWWEL